MVRAVLIFLHQPGDHGICRNRGDEFDAVTVFDQEADLYFAEIINNRLLLYMVTEGEESLFSFFYFFD